MKKIYILIFYCLSFLLHAQTKTNINPVIAKLEKKKDSSTEEAFANGQQMLKLSTNDCERTKAYLRMGDAKYKSLDYYEALKYLRKSDSLAPKCNLLEDHLVANFISMLIFNHLDLENDFENSWEKVRDISAKIDDPSVAFMLMQANALGYEQKKNYAEAVIYRKQISDYVVNLLKSGNSDGSKLFLAMSYSQLCYVYLKSHNPKEAKLYSDKIPELIEGISEEQNYLLDLQYLVNAMLFAENNEKVEAKKWFDKALFIARKRKQPGSIAKIIEERLHYGVDEDHDRQTLLKELMVINQNKLKESSKYSSKEIEINKDKVSKVNHQLRNTIVGISILLFIIFIFFIINEKKNRKTKKRFEEIISSLETERRKNLEKLNTEEKVTENINISNKEVEQDNRIMPSETEKELLRKLREFEKGTDFTSKNFSFPNFISLLETNSKYANYIIKHHRNKNFNDYINGLRIQFIIEKLYHHPEYLQYKINYLAEISGFSTHSRFAQIFKNETGISPSKFIQKLIDKNREELS